MDITKGSTVIALLTGERGTVTYVSPEGAVNVSFPDNTNCRLAPSEYSAVKTRTLVDRSSVKVGERLVTELGTADDAMVTVLR